MKTLVTSLLALLFCNGAPRAQGDVLVVASAGGAPYTSIQAAVDAAALGDVVLVKAGTYDGFRVIEGVAIVADEAAGVVVNGTIIVNGISQEQSLLVHRLQANSIGGPTDDYGPALTVKFSAGSVRAQSCLLQGSADRPGARFTSSGAAALVDSLARTNSTGFDLEGAGVHFAGGNLALYGCEARGGAGPVGPSNTQPPACYGKKGGPGLLANAFGFVFAGTTMFQGGQGGAGGSGCSVGPVGCCGGGDGGNGVALLDSTQTWWRYDDLLLGGGGGLGGVGSCGCDLSTSCTCDAGSTGATIVSTPGDALSAVAGQVSTLSVAANPLRELATTTIRVQAQVGDVVHLAVARTPAFVPEVGRGVRLVGADGHFGFRDLGPTDASGRVELVWTVPALVPGVESSIVHVQALVKRVDGKRLWSNPVQIVVLDQAF